MIEDFKNFFTLIDENDPMQVGLVGETYCDKTFDIARECSDLNALEFIIDGKGTLNIDGQTLYPEKNDIFFLKYGSNHHYYSDEKNPWHKLWIVFDGAMANALIDCYLPKDTYLFSNCINLKKYFEEIVEISKQSYSYELMVNRITVCLVQIFMFIHNRVQIENEELPDIIRKKLDESTEIDLNLDEFCKSINYSKNYVINVFKEKFKITPYRYFLERKIDAAKAYLAHTNMSIGDISKVLHYSDQQYFSTSFKNTVGCSPLEYRKRTRTVNSSANQYIV
ncbi:MAG: AraC family transcriptional regulator [Clostridiales bacterium]|nr:AraC family transcriptional regulator [Clostridiales bacterium]